MQAFIDRLAILSGNEALLQQLVVWLSAFSAFVLVLGGAALVMNYFDPIRRRVDKLSPERAAARSSMLLKAAGSIGPVAAFVLPQDELERNKMMTKLHRAGFRTAMALQVFYLIKTLLVLVAPLAVFVASKWMPDTTSGNVMLYAMMAAGVGMLVPNVVLEKLEAKRMRAVSNGFPDALDLLVVCVESGLGLAAGLQRVADELSVSHPDLAYELSTVNAEIRVGVQREQALKNLAERTGLEDIRGLVGLLVQTMRFGTGVADALRVYSEEFRDKRTQKAEEQAAKMGTKLVFPLVLFMFPMFFIVAIGPAVIRIIDAFSKI
jgi:tight adherence protein C